MNTSAMTRRECKSSDTCLSLFQPRDDVQNRQFADLGVNVLFLVTAEDGAEQEDNPGRIGRRDRNKRLSPSGSDIQLDDLLRDGRGVG
jgi:hypothetical protein